MKFNFFKSYLVVALFSPKDLFFTRKDNFAYSFLTFICGWVIIKLCIITEIIYSEEMPCFTKKI